MSDSSPTRTQRDLADVVEMLLDKGVVINADIAVSIGDTELLGIRLRAALASFETAAEYGLEFPEGTDMQRVAAASGHEALSDPENPERKDVMNLHNPPIGESSSSGSDIDEGDETADTDTTSDTDDDETSTTHGNN